MEKNINDQKEKWGNEIWRKQFQVANKREFMLNLARS